MTARNNSSREAALNAWAQALDDIEQWHETHDARVDEMPPELVSRLRRSTSDAVASLPADDRAECEAWLLGEE